jgi:hypothetical protein
MTDYPTNITWCKVDTAFVNIEDVLHAKVQSDNGSTRVTNNTLGLTSSAWSVKYVKWMGRNKRNTISNHAFLLH